MLRIASACATREAFVALFGHYCDGQAIFVATRHPRPAGEDVSFTITLAGGEPLIVATGRVEGSFLDGTGPHGRAGMLIRFHDVAAGSRALVDELAAVPPPTPGFARGTEPPGMAVPGRDDVAEPDSETRPAGLPRAVIGNRARVTPSHVVVPRPPGPLTVKPAATPPPILLEKKINRDDDPTGVKPMEAIVQSRRRYPDDGEFSDERAWDDQEEQGERRSRGVALRADAAGRLDASSLEALADCAVFEENAVCDERGLPTTAPAPVVVARGQEDAWDDDETIPPWLRGPQPDEVMDAGTGSIEIEAVPESTIGRIVGRVEFHDPSPVSEPAAPPPAPSPPLPVLPSLTFSTARSLDHEPPASVAADLSAVGESDPSLILRRRGRWALVLGASLLSAGIGLAVGYVVGTGGLLTRAGAAEPARQTAAPSTASTPPASSSPGPEEPAASPSPAPAAVADGDSEEAATPDDGAAAVPAPEAKPEEESTEEDGERSGRGRKGKKAAARERALGRDRCAAEVESDPSGSEIVVAGEVVGTTPGRIELACGAHEVEVRRTRYQSALRRLRLRPGKLEKVDVRLERPDHKLRITTTPPGAAVTVNGRPAGLTPLVANVRGYQHIRVRIERPGFEAWAEKVYAREPLTKLTVKLTPARGSIIPQGKPSIELSPAFPPPPAAPPSADAGAR